uniref:ORF45 n=1 Tax=Nitrosopumilaceae spindle-shaped virus TaxID=3065433 RepID=A0AAT9JAN4_9VIRU
MSKYTREQWNHRRIKCMYGRFSCELTQHYSNKVKIE